MTELRETVYNAIREHTEYIDQTDAAIRAFADAMRKPEVVKEAAKEVGALDDRFYDGSAIDAMQCALEAALKAIGATEEPV